MLARIPSASLSFWGRSSLAVALLGVPLYASCTSSEDTEPFIPAVEGATQPKGEGALITEDDACGRLLKAAGDAYKRLGCDVPDFAACPAFLRPGGGSGCFEYYEGSVEACETTYKNAPSCRELSPCLAAAERNDDLSTCEVAMSGTGGAGGAAPGALAGAANAVGGATALAEAGASSGAGAASVAGQPAGGAGG